MKEEAQQPWEAEVRRVVETHEFEYDPAAWAGMEELLDQAALPYAKPTGSWWAQAWKWLLPSVVAMGGLLWFALQPASEPPSVQGTFPISLETEEKAALRGGIASSAFVRTPRQVKALPKLQRRPIDPLELPPPELPVPVIAVPPAVPALPTIGPATLLLPNESDNSLGATIKRKRNRRTLFPDVIKNY